MMTCKCGKLSESFSKEWNYNGSCLDCKTKTFGLITRKRNAERNRKKYITAYKNKQMDKVLELFPTT